MMLDLSEPTLLPPPSSILTESGDTLLPPSSSLQGVSRKVGIEECGLAQLGVLLQAGRVLWQPPIGRGTITFCQPGMEWEARKLYYVLMSN